MTCKDCKYFTNKKVENMGDTDLVFCDAFDKNSVTRASQWANECKSFESNDGTYFNGTWHCPRCGVPVSEWGLCMDCEILYVTPKRKIVPVNLKVENIYKHESDFSDIDNDIEDKEIENSWESVSK